MSEKLKTQSYKCDNFVNEVVLENLDSAPLSTETATVRTTRSGTYGDSTAVRAIGVALLLSVVCLLTRTYSELNPQPWQFFIYLAPSYESISPWADLAKIFAGFDFYNPANFSRSPVAYGVLQKHGCKNVVDAFNSPECYIIAKPNFLQPLAKLFAEHHHQALSFTLVFAKPEAHFYVWKPTVRILSKDSI